MVKTNTATLLPEKNQLGSLEIYRDGISSWRNSIASLFVNKVLDNKVSTSESIVPTAPIITTEPIISAELDPVENSSLASESLFSTEPIISAESAIPTSNQDISSNDPKIKGSISV